MSTKLTKPLSRETFSSLRSGGRVLIVTLLPGDLVEIREKGRRMRYLVPIVSIAWMGIKIEAAAAKKAKAQARKERSGK